MSRKIVLLLQHICKHINLIIILLLMLFFFECDIHVKIDSGICFLSHSSWLCALIQQQWLNIQFWLKIVSVPTIKSCQTMWKSWFTSLNGLFFVATFTWAANDPGPASPSMENVPNQNLQVKLRTLNICFLLTHLVEKSHTDFVLDI